MHFTLKFHENIFIKSITDQSKLTPSAFRLCTRLLTKELNQSNSTPSLAFGKKIHCKNRIYFSLKAYHEINYFTKAQKFIDISSILSSIGLARRSENELY
jgi:hypothetical protein